MNKAGAVLRSILFPDSASMMRTPKTDADFTLLAEAFDVLVGWRAAHARPLQAATMGLRSRVSTAKCSQVEVSQRLKRIPPSLDKLRREPAMRLGRMEDVGGCRAVLRDLYEVHRVLDRYRRGTTRIVRVRNYIEQPKKDGYRAIHVIVRHRDRKIEVQLRTRTQHEWAYTVESVTARLGVDIKAGVGPPQVRDWFAAVSEAMACEEYGEMVSPELLERVSTLRQKALPYLRGRLR